jgi:hypothetical protein
LVPAPEFAVHLEEVAMSNAQPRTGFTRVRFGLNVFSNSTTLVLTADNVVSTEGTILIYVDTSRVPSRYRITGCTVTASREKDDNRIRVIILFLYDSDRVGRSSEVLRIVAGTVLNSLSAFKPLAIAIETRIERETIRIG